MYKLLDYREAVTGELQLLAVSHLVREIAHRQHSLHSRHLYSTARFAAITASQPSIFVEQLKVIERLLTSDFNPAINAIT